MDALGKLLRSMIWDDIDAQNCEEMFNVSRATIHTGCPTPDNQPLPSSPQEDIQHYPPTQGQSFFLFNLQAGGHPVIEEAEKGGEGEGKEKSNTNEEY